MALKEIIKEIEKLSTVVLKAGLTISMAWLLIELVSILGCYQPS